MSDICQKGDVKLLEFGGEEEQIHLLYESHPVLKPSVFINNLKATSSRFVRKHFPDHLKPFYWKPV